MSLQLDARQRAMLAEMGVRIFESPPDPAHAAVPPAAVARQPAAAAQLRATPPQPPGEPLPAPAVPVASPEPHAQPGRLAVEPLPWDALREAVAACQACGLGETRRAPVFGRGPAQADWLVVGEPPGEEEDLQGEPFAGAAGQLLGNMLRAVGLGSGERVFVTNVVRCRPPGRNPQPEELAACAGFLRRQVQLLQPKVILAMGRFAVQGLLDSAEPLGRLRGRAHRFEGVPVVVTYHPLALLRNPAEKGKAWADLCLARALADGAA